MNDIQLYDNGIFSARVIQDENSQIWIVAKDVAQALGYSQESIETPGKLFGHVPEIWTDRKRILVSSVNGIEQMREVLCLTEQGLYFFL